MYICVKCRKEMICECNGLAADFGGGHCYIGDSYKCPSCGAETLATNAHPFSDPDHCKTISGKYLQMS